MPTPTMRAKFKVSSVEKFDGGTEKVNFIAVSGKFPYPDDGSDEDNTYAKFSPSANCSILIANPALYGKHSVGQKFYVDFTPAES